MCHQRALHSGTALCREQGGSKHPPHPPTHLPSLPSRHRTSLARLAALPCRYYRMRVLGPDDSHAHCVVMRIMQPGEAIK